MVLSSRGNKRRLRSRALHQFKPKEAAVKRERAFQIGHLQVDVADLNPLVDAPSGLSGVGRCHDLQALMRRVGHLQDNLAASVARFDLLMGFRGVG
jgi:hypothetical protein